MTSESNTETAKTYKLCDVNSGINQSISVEAGRVAARDVTSRVRGRAVGGVVRVGRAVGGPTRIGRHTERRGWISKMLVTTV